ncbi:MAG: restriction endonuclease [Halobacteriota archaeon]
MVNQDSRKENDFLQYIDVIQDLCADVSQRKIAELFQVTDGKKIGTYIERECKRYLEQRTGLTMEGSAALGKDLPLFNIDIKTTSAVQPQSSSPYRSLDEKIFGLPYNVLLFIYRKEDKKGYARLGILRCCYIPKELTGDYSTTRLARELRDNYLRKEIGVDEIIGRLEEKLGITEVADLNVTPGIVQRIIDNPPSPGVLTISFALQWRLQYGRMKEAPFPEGVIVIL